MPRFQLRSVLPAIPALFTRIDSGPSASSVCLTAAATWLSEQTSPAIARPSSPAATDSARVPILVEDRDPGSRPVQPAGDTRPDPLPGAGHAAPPGRSNQRIPPWECTRIDESES